MGGVNLAIRDSDEARLLNQWYTGPVLADYLGACADGTHRSLAN